VWSVGGKNTGEKKLNINNEVHFVGYLCIMDWINAQKIEHIKIL
jgi:hypothetical protein